jgi:hypothetical protein
MRKANQIANDSKTYALLNSVPMSESERRLAVNAMRNAETIADALLWVSEKLRALGALFLKPGLKH